MTNSFPEAKLRIRMSSRDAHYAGNLVDGARILNLFGDLATELTIRYDVPLIVADDAQIASVVAKKIKSDQQSYHVIIEPE